MKTESHPSRQAKQGNYSATKFIPNLTELGEATKELPDAKLWPEDNCLCPITVDQKQRVLKFTRKEIKRGASKTYRWVYEGKVLIRNRDIPEGH